VGAAAGGGASLPCEVSKVLKASCGECHGATPLNGAPMSLVSYADLTAPARSDPTHKVYELVAARVEDRARPMPPDPTKRLPDASIAMLKSWSAAGAMAGAACTEADASAAPGGGAAGGAAVGTTSVANSSEKAPDIEQCYELRAHGQSAPGDKSKYAVPAGENYTSFIFKAPWTTEVQGLRFRHLGDNAAVVHHWLLFSETASRSDGEVEPCDLSGPTGILCGIADTRALITGWAPGRGDFALPEDVGLELPGPGKLLAVELHYNNSGGAVAMDQSGVEVCVTSKFRKNTATVSWLGTETINIPAKSTGMASGTCSPKRAGMNATDPIHVLYSWPHMHKTGTHLKSVVNRADGKSDVMYDGDFSFNFQVLYDTPVLLNPGDTVTTTCTFNNPENREVAFGASTQQEMCFNFTYAWPAHALDNQSSMIGASLNSCW